MSGSGRNLRVILLMIIPVGINSPGTFIFGHAGRSAAGYLPLRENVGSNPTAVARRSGVGKPLLPVRTTRPRGCPPP